MTIAQKELLLTRIVTIQKELEQFKKILSRTSEKKKVKIGGILKGWKVSDGLIEEAKKSLFKCI